MLAYLVWLRDQRECAPSTITNYAGVLARFLDECVGGRHFDAVPPEDIESWLLRPRACRARGPARSPRRRRGASRTLRSLYKYLTARGYCSRNVAALVTSPRVRFGTASRNRFGTRPGAFRLPCHWA